MHWTRCVKRLFHQVFGAGDLWSAVCAFEYQALATHCAGTLLTSVDQAEVWGRKGLICCAVHWFVGVRVERVADDNLAAQKAVIFGWDFS